MFEYVQSDFREGGDRFGDALQRITNIQTEPARAGSMDRCCGLGTGPTRFRARVGSEDYDRGPGLTRLQVRLGWLSSSQSRREEFT
jgi:hypothetical protein